jgi:ribA/ribD-fused uncharacterized protein
MTEKIDKFSGEYEFLSNMYPCSVTYNGITYKCSEAAYQAQKQPEIAKVFTNVDGYTAKRLGKTVTLRLDWEEVKFRIMAQIVLLKFTQNKDLAEKLLNTGDAQLIEGNWWGDIYWGVCTNKKYNGVGENYLGKILMYVRSVLDINSTKYRELIKPDPMAYKPFTTEEELKPSPVIKYTTRYEIKDIDSFNVIKYIDDMLYKLYYGNAREEVCINTALVPKDIQLVGIPFINSDHKMQAICPKCGMTIDFLGKLNKETMEVKTKTKFCQYCGQKFNWFTRHLF